MRLAEAQALVRGWPFDSPARVHAPVWWEQDQASGDGELSPERMRAQLDVEIERMVGNLECCHRSARKQLRLELDLLLRQRRQTEALEWGDEG